RSERVEAADDRLGPSFVAERRSDRAGHLRVALGIEPDMRIDVVARAVQPYVVEDVERGAATVPARTPEGGVEAVPRVHDERRIVDPRHVARAQLDVVRLLAR